jgi:hypothetical protein
MGVWVAGLVGADVDVADGTRPPGLSVVIATRDPYPSLAPVLDALVPQLLDVGGEVVVACRDAPAVPAGGPVVVVASEDDNLLSLRRLAIDAARADVIAVGEDHAVPTPQWCGAVLRAHREHPDAPVVAGCLVNGSDGTAVGRANFLGFAAPFTPPMRTLERPPPVSALSFKRAALRDAGPGPGAVESVLVPRLFDQGAMVIDDRIVVVHFQDRGLRWTLVNAFCNTRANYGYAAARAEFPRRTTLRSIATGMCRRQWREAWTARHEFKGVAAAVLTAAVCVATTAGAFVGVLVGPGRAAERVA